MPRRFLGKTMQGVRELDAIREGPNAVDDRVCRGRIAQGNGRLPVVMFGNASVVPAVSIFAGAVPFDLGLPFNVAVNQ